MNDETKTLTERLATQDSGLETWLWLPLLRLLASGAPVEVADLAAATGRPAEEVRQALAAVPDTEYDEDGRIVGLGLTLRPTRHHFAVDGRQLYTWCALDTLIFPALLDKAVTIESLSPTTRTPVRVHAGPDGVTKVEPPTAVVSLVNHPADMSSVRSAFCNQVHYFASAEDARPWLERHPDAEVTAVKDAYRLALAMTTNMLNEHTPVGHDIPRDTPGQNPRCC